MILVKTYLDKSSIAGVGLFALEFIPKGTKIWEYTPGLDMTLDSISEFDSLSEEFLTTYCFKCNGKYVLCIDNSRFINHSDFPNLDDSSFEYTIAKRDILKGEELTSNYSEFGRIPEDNNFNPL